MTETDGPTPDVSRVDRRQHAPCDHSPVGILTQMPALVVLDRIPVPVLAIDERGVIVFANRTFAGMVGHSPEHVTGRPFRELLSRPADGPVTGADLVAYAGTVIDFQHAENWQVRAKMSESALLRGNDTGYLVAFEDITELVWERAAH